MTTSNSSVCESNLITTHFELCCKFYGCDNICLSAGFTLDYACSTEFDIISCTAGCGITFPETQNFDLTSLPAVYTNISSDVYFCKTADAPTICQPVVNTTMCVSSIIIKDFGQCCTYYNGPDCSYGDYDLNPYCAEVIYDGKPLNVTSCTP